MKEKIKEFLSKIDLIGTAFACFLLFCMFSVSTINQSLIMLGLTALYAFKLHLERLAIPNVNKQVVEELNRVKSAVDALKVASSVRREPNAKVERLF